ncbi:hypothetical protein Sulku_2634 (plasmid) [Sulfuricurvum kujiense DSM 16994]|uniref:Uncharacterized protein n=1 Tax=Sulfuricurvum kujiense (strain ATCC BAA-921 / DSM 16994 / JCM 11577 / YK-1) TaxID=709032 RepID=E4U3M1_SULKY|nr:hypothetical protein [Sulfuricurvum kujiense]ADR35287.1 hypothetical protein Sulku_2634 [Sulfuricurvum kujiense DSM 16994]
MGKFKGFKKSDEAAQVNHFEEVAKTAEKTGPGTFGRPVVDEYKKQDKRCQFYISQEMIDTLTPIAFSNGCKDVTAYAKKIFVDEFERVKKDK